MGREIRRVPPNWEHPKDKQGRFKPIFNSSFENAASQWKNDFISWEFGGRPHYNSEGDEQLEFWEYYGGPPDRKYYRIYQDEEATWFPVYENVSEGTPVTPPFATKEELVEYLCKFGDFWNQVGWSLKSAQRFAEDEYAPSFMVFDEKIYEPKNMADILE